MRNQPAGLQPGSGANDHHLPGQLKQSGTPFTGTANLEFALFDQPGGGGQVGPTLVRNNWPVSDGLFQAELDFGAVFDGSPRFLQVQVNGTPLIPRQAVRPAPLALHALSADVPPFNGWRLDGNANTDANLDFLGTTNLQALVLRAGNAQGLRISPFSQLFDDLPSTANLVAGSHVNSVGANFRGATVSGGGVHPDSSDTWAQQLGGAGPNAASGDYATIGGGVANQATDAGTTVSGGGNNLATYFASTIGGGARNSASGAYSTVAGGQLNRAINDYTFIAGGFANTAIGLYSIIPGGSSNCAGSAYSLAAGRRAIVRPGGNPNIPFDPCSNLPSYGNDQGTFVWADSQNENFISSGPNQFLIRAGGGVGIGTNAPDAQLNVVGFGTTSGGVSGFNEVIARVRTTTVNRHTALAVDAQPGRDGILYLGEAGEAHWGLRHNSSADRFDIRRHGDGDGVNYLTIIRANGHVGIGTTNPGAFRLAVNGSAAKPGGGEWSVFSDARLKHDIAPIAPGMLDRLLALKGYTFRYNDDAVENRLALSGEQIGLLAHEVAEVFPDWVDADDAGYLYVTARGTTALFIEALRELRVEKDEAVAVLRRDNDALAVANAALHERLASLEQSHAEDLSALRAELALMRELLPPALAGGQQ